MLIFYIASPFLLVASIPLVVSIQHDLRPAVRNACFVAVFLIASTFFGVIGYIFIPAKHLIADSYGRATEQSLYELLGEEASYNVQYRDTQPELYAERKTRIEADRLHYLRLWATATAVVGSTLVLISITVNRLRPDQATIELGTHAQHPVAK